MRHLFVSPHFDDAIGSCGGTIARLIAAGEEVEVRTVFGGVAREPFSFPATILHEEWGLNRPVEHRRNEDAAACAILGCQRLFLEFGDAIYRQDGAGNHLYPTFDALKGDLVDPQLAVLIADQIGTADLTYCPQAIGGHVDHVLARNAGRLLERRGANVVYYRDFYYDSGAPLDAREIAIALTDAERAKKLAAFRCYASQIRDLFGTEVAMVSYFETIGAQERFLVPAARNRADRGRPASLLRS